MREVDFVVNDLMLPPGGWAVSERPLALRAAVADGLL
jgi:hypothetical protein